jgi:UDP-glucose 4-epimerase
LTCQIASTLSFEERRRGDTAQMTGDPDMNKAYLDITMKVSAKSMNYRSIVGWPPVRDGAS